MNAPRLFLPRCGWFAGCVLLWLGTPAAAQGPSAAAYGSTQRTAGALIGIFYDFKQTQKREPLPMDRHLFEKQVAYFIDHHWDEGLLNTYYRVPRALYTTELNIPTIDADKAPQAFGVEKTVQPRMWMVHYKGQVAPPADGTYRFLGSADDFLAVAVNGETVLVADIPGTRLQVKWFARESTNLRSHQGETYTAGDWVNLRAGQPVDLDVITGESPGGQSRCLLGIEKKGAVYSGEAPLFQLTATRDTLPGVLPWRGVQ